MGKHEPRGLPASFDSAEKAYALYEDVAYTDYWDDVSQARQDALERVLVEELLPAQGARIVDVGCGYGRLAPCYLDRFETVVLFDGSMSLLRQAQETYGDRVLLVAGDVMRLPFRSGAFDQVLTVRVLQHLPDLDGAIRSLHRILADRGQLLFSYHNKRNANRILHYRRSRRIADPFSLESAEVSPTLISHHPARMAALLADAGFMPPEYRGAVVIDPLARLGESLGRNGTPGLRWSRFTGRHLLAPWLVGRADARGGPALDAHLAQERIFCCPRCSGELDRDEAGDMTCRACGGTFPNLEGVLDFRT